MSVPAHQAPEPPAHRHRGEGVNRPGISRDLLNVCARRDLSDRAVRMYVMLHVATRELSLPEVCDLTGQGSRQAEVALAELGRAGLVCSRLRTMGYHGDGRRIRRTVYRVAGGAAA